MASSSPRLTVDRDNTTDDLSNKDRLATDCPKVSFDEVGHINLENKKRRKKVVKDKNYDDSYIVK